MRTVGQLAAEGSTCVASVVTATPGGVGVDEVQTLTIDGAGEYTLDFNGQETSLLSSDDDAAAIEAALIALSNIGPTDVAVTGTGPFTITFGGGLAATNVAQLVPTGHNTHASVPTEEREGSISVQFLVEQVGGTPTITFKVQSSFDGPEIADDDSNWADLELDPLDNSGAGLTFTKTQVGTYQYAVPPQDQPRKIRLVTSDITNVTYSATAHQ